jgi:hypothetical protein
MSISAFKWFTLTLMLIISSMGKCLFAQTLARAGANGKPGAAPVRLPGSGNLVSPDLFTGIANISIPIYSYSVEGQDFSVGLHYNTKGVRVDEVASAAGLHWEVGSGPTIFRMVKDIPDEINLEMDTTLWVNTVEWNPYSPMYNVNRYWWLKGKYASYSESSSSKVDTNVYRDGEADDFVVSLGGSTFKFNLGKDGFIFTNPRRGIKIEVLLDGIPITSISDFQSVGLRSNESQKFEFKITDEEGFQYRFIRGDYEEREVLDVYGRGNVLASYWCTTKWVVKEILLPGGGKIEYTYNHLAFVKSQFPTYMAYSRKEGAYSNYVYPAEFRSTSPRIALPSSISFANGTNVSFVYDSQIRPDFYYGALRKIRVMEGSDCIIDYDLVQSFFHASSLVEKNYSQAIGTPDSLARLRLDGINMRSCDGLEYESFYKFFYEQDVQLPSRLSVAQDYFGYYNGQHMSSADSSTIPYHALWDDGLPTTVYYGNNREPNGSFIRAGILKKIRNGYSGEVELHYGLHGIGSSGNFPPGIPADTGPSWHGATAGEGLRLDSITERDFFHTDKLSSTIFVYSGGQRFSPGGFFHFPVENWIRNGNWETAHILYNGSFVSSRPGVRGSNQGYSNVQVLRKNESGQLISKTEYTFSNLSDATSGNIPRYFRSSGGKWFHEFPFSDKQYLRDWEIGLPLETKEFDQHGLLVARSVNGYTFSIDTTSAAGKVENCKSSSITLLDIKEADGLRFARADSVDCYIPYRGQALLTTSVQFKYASDNQYVVDSCFQTYDSYGNLEGVITVASNGQRKYTKQIFNYHIDAGPGNHIYEMNQAGIEKIIASETWLLDEGNPVNPHLLDAHINTFEFGNGRLLPSSVYKLNTSNPITYISYLGSNPIGHNIKMAFTGLAVPHFKKVSEVVQYDIKGNIIETYSPLTKQFTSMLRDTSTGKVFAQANCKLSDLGYTGFEKTFKGGFNYNQSNVAWITNPFSGKNAYWLGGTEITRSNLSENSQFRIGFWYDGPSPPNCVLNGIPLTLVAGPQKDSWTWYEGRFQTNSSSDVLSLSGAYNGFVDELRLHPLGTGVETHDHRGFTAVYSSSDMRGRYVFYEYDKYGRLILLRDQDGNILKKTEYTMNNY